MEANQLFATPNEILTKIQSLNNLPIELLSFNIEKTNDSQALGSYFFKVLVLRDNT